jgi:hypothetical protein
MTRFQYRNTPAAARGEGFATVRSRALDHREQLMANWECGLKLLPMEMIPGAKDDD